MKIEIEFINAGGAVTKRVRVEVPKDGKVYVSEIDALISEVKP